MRLLLLLSIALLVSGCASKRTPQTASATPSPAPTATPFPVSVGLQGARLTIADTKTGKTQLELSTPAATVAPQGVLGNLSATLEGNAATLYDKGGKPSLRMTAQKIQADTKKNTVTAVGAVQVETIEPPQRRLRADTMVWNATKHQLTGSGNVLLEQGTEIQFPVETFTTDTRLERISATFGDKE